MSSIDPFDRVLETLGLLQQIQSMDPIPTTVAIPSQQNNKTDVPCDIQVKDPNGSLLALSDIPNAARTELALKLIKHFHPPAENTTRIRPISLVLFTDGTMQTVPVHMVHSDNRPGTYPPWYRLPPMRDNLSPQEQVWRAEKFALGTLLYEVLVGRRMFEGEPRGQIQQRYASATFPQLGGELPAWAHPLIYACWSAAFGCYIALSRFNRYVHDHPVRFGLQATLAVVSTAALITVPILGAIGFSAIGPVAGSVAAGWQASIGLVEAGSLFALCQSAAMGGAVATGLVATGATTGALALATVGLPSMEILREIFIQKFRGEHGGAVRL